MKTNRKGFTLIELLVVISIISLLSSIVFSSLNTAREAGRDSVRLSDMNTIRLALQQFYLDNNGRYPEEHEGENGSGDGSWEGSTENNGNFVNILVDRGYLPANIIDPVNNSGYEYSYHRYNAGTNGCPVDRGAYYVLGFRRSEKHKNYTDVDQSPGWSCTRVWNTEFAWVTGGFEN